MGVEYKSEAEKIVEFISKEYYPSVFGVLGASHDDDWDSYAPNDAKYNNHEEYEER